MQFSQRQSDSIWTICIYHNATIDVFSISNFEPLNDIGRYLFSVFKG